MVMAWSLKGWLIVVRRVVGGRRKLRLITLIMFREREREEEGGRSERRDRRDERGVGIDRRQWYALCDVRILEEVRLRIES